MSTSAPAALSPEFIADEILPTRELHFIAGPSGSGKTTLMFQMIDTIRNQQKLFGWQTTPIPMCYAACDRSEAGIRRTLKRMKITDPIPFFSLYKTTLGSIENVIIKARSLVPGCKLLFIDAIGRLTPEGKLRDYKVVSDFLTAIVALCEKYDITVIGLTHSPKCKEGEQYINPRQRLMGSTAWAAFCETIFLIEPIADNPEERVLYLLPRNVAEDEFTLAFVDGLLEETSPEGLIFEVLEQHLWPTIKSNYFYTRLEIMELVGQCQIKCNPKTIDRWLRGKVKDGYLKKPKRGVYERLLPC